MTPDHGGRADGTDRNDNLLGSYGPDTIIGLGGNDIIWANRKPDGTSRGTDHVDAGAGDDIVYGASRGGTTYIDGGDGNDYLQGGGAVATNFITGGAGADTIRLTGDGPTASTPATATTSSTATPRTPRGSTAGRATTS